MCELNELPDDENVRTEMLRLLDEMEAADDDASLPSLAELRCAAAAELDQASVSSPIERV